MVHSGSRWKLCLNKRLKDVLSQLTSRKFPQRVKFLAETVQRKAKPEPNVDIVSNERRVTQREWIEWKNRYGLFHKTLGKHRSYSGHFWFSKSFQHLHCCFVVFLSTVAKLNFCFYLISDEKSPTHSVSTCKEAKYKFLHQVIRWMNKNTLKLLWSFVLAFSTLLHCAMKKRFQ